MRVCLMKGPIQALHNYAGIFLVLLLDGLLDLEGSLNSPLPLVLRECTELDGAAVFKIQILFREIQALHNYAGIFLGSFRE